MWIKRLGVSESKIVEIYDAIIREHGFGAKLIVASAASISPLIAQVETELVPFEGCRARIYSEEFAAWLLEQPEPLPEALEVTLKAIKDALADVREHFTKVAKVGPQHRRGGRNKELDDPKKRQAVRDRVKYLREPGSNLNEIFRRVGGECGVSDTTVKRIWSEGNPNVKRRQKTL